jgi:hypothetical protein
MRQVRHTPTSRRRTDLRRTLEIIRRRLAMVVIVVMAGGALSCDPIGLRGWRLRASVATIYLAGRGGRLSAAAGVFRPRRPI